MGPDNRIVCPIPFSHSSGAAPAIEFPAYLKKIAERNAHIGRAHPAVHVSAESPILSPIISAEPDRHFPAKLVPAPRDARGIGRLP